MLSHEFRPNGTPCSQQYRRAASGRASISLLTIATLCLAFTACGDGGASGAPANGGSVAEITPTPSPESPPVLAPSISTDFATRCSAPGVIRCVGFDGPADFNTNGDSPSGAYGETAGILPPFGTADFTKATRDTTVKASGASSLKFTIPANSGADSSGSYFTNFSDDLSLQFGENSEFYVQWRQRFSATFLATAFAGGGGWKQLIIGTGDQPGKFYASCTALETVVQNTHHRGFPQMYNSCEGSASHGPYDPFEEPFNAFDFKLQNARPDPYCLYSQSGSSYFAPNGNCFGYTPDEWMTFQVRIKTGPRVNNEFVNSYVTLWLAREGQPSEEIFAWGPYKLSAGDPADNQRFGKVWLLPYNTGKSEVVENPVAYTWYDELIISRQRVIDP